MPRTLLAVVGGYAASIVVVGLGALAEGAAFGPAATVGLTTRFLSVRIAISFAGAVMAGYTCGRVAPAGRRVLSLALLAVLFCAVAVVSSRLSGEGSQTLAIHALVTLLGMIGLIAGAMTERAIHAGAPAPHSA